MSSGLQNPTQGKSGFGGGTTWRRNMSLGLQSSTSKEIGFRRRGSTSGKPDIKKHVEHPSEPDVHAGSSSASTQRKARKSNKAGFGRTRTSSNMSKPSSKPDANAEGNPEPDRRKNPDAEMGSSPFFEF
ncbi:hypothetical protein KI387_002442, partial [Taxus chinensis]